MTDQVDQTIVPAEVGNTPAEPSNNSVEEQARSLGWVPKEEYVGDEVKWLDAGEFVRRQPLFEKIEQQNRELREIKRTVAQFAKHHAQVKETEYQRALETLKAEKQAAFEDGDAKKIIHIDDKIADLKDEQKRFQEEQAAQVKQEAQQIHPEFEAWTNRNTWYATDPAMRAYADAVGTQVAKPGMSPADVLKEVEKRVRTEFPHRFKNANREKPAAVEGTSSRGASSKESYSPSDFERQIARKFVRQGLYKSEDDYYKELKLLNGKS